MEYFLKIVTFRTKKESIKSINKNNDTLRAKPKLRKVRAFLVPPGIITGLSTSTALMAGSPSSCLYYSIFLFKFYTSGLCSEVELLKIKLVLHVYSFEQVPANSSLYPKFIEASTDSDFSAVVSNFPPCCCKSPVFILSSTFEFTE